MSPDIDHQISQTRLAIRLETIVADEGISEAARVRIAKIAPELVERQLLTPDQAQRVESFVLQRTGTKERGP